MLYRCVTKISIQQITTSYTGKKRDKLLLFDFVSSFTAKNNWEDLTNKATIVLPKNISIRDKDGKLFPLGGVNQSIGGFDKETPLFLRGDAVTITFGYIYPDKLGNDFLDLPKQPIFTGYISKVISKKPIELECEDNMWKLKQLPAEGGENGLFRASKYIWEDVLRELMKTTAFTVNALTKTNIGDFRLESYETVAQVIERVRKDYHLEAYFRGNELRTGSKVYIDAESVESTFKFQQNIISDDLEYTRKDDVVLSAICYSVNKFELSGTTKRGRKKTTSKRLEIIVYTDRKGTFKYVEKTSNKSFPENVQGERRTFYFNNVKSVTDLFNKGVDQLKKYYYTGFKGKFTTFAIPFIKLGDNVNLLDDKLPERNGRYKVKGVEYTGGIDGHRQIIELDYLIFQLDAKGKIIPSAQASGG